MSETDSSRRGFLKLTGSAVSGSWLASQWPALLAIGQAACEARDKGVAFSHLDAGLAADLAAIAAQIIPGDDTPGAEEAGVIYFIDGALDTIMKGAAGFLKDGIAQLNTKVTLTYDGKRFSQLEPEQQVTILRQEDQSAFLVP